MCGIFGLIRNTQARNPERATAAFVELGRLAVERGKDAAGFALTNPSPAARRVATRPTSRDVETRSTVIDEVTVFKDVCSFTDLWDDTLHLAPLAAHRVALGHTRWATQGKKDALTNASPLVVGNLVGTHNGDVDTRSVLGKYTLPRPVGSTDTEVLYQALDRDRLDRRKVTEVLRNVEGRAALAWLDRGRSDRVYLARAALSPLAIAFDAEGNLYWASNPRWFRDIDTRFDGGLGFHDITLVEEGVLLTVSLAEDAPVVEDMRRFTPKCRPSDARLSDMVVWRGFADSDRDADKAQKRHTVAPARYSGWSKTGTGTGAGKASSRSGGWSTAQDNYALVKSAAESAAVLRSLPDYDDTLTGIGNVEFSPASFDPDEVDQAGLWDDAELLHMDEEEAMCAANKWVEDGADPAVLGVLRSASMPSEIENLMSEFDLTSVHAFERFRNIVQGWVLEGSH